MEKSRIHFPLVGLQLFLASVSLRMTERWWEARDVKNAFPEIVITGLPTWGTPIELWSSPWAEIVLAAGLGSCLVAAISEKLRAAALALIAVLLLYSAPGGSAIAKSLIFMLPMTLYCGVLALRGEFRREKRSLDFWHSTLGWGFLAAMYGFNALSKTGPEWMSGSALPDFLSSNVWGPGWLESHREAGVWRLLGYALMAWEFLGFFLFYPSARFRKYYGVTAIVFHGLLFFVSPFRVFGLSVTAIWILLWTSGHERAPRDKRVPWAVACWFIWILCANLANLKLPTLPAAVTKPWVSTSLYPHWRLFSPSPAKGRYHVIFATPTTTHEVRERGGKMSFLFDLAKDQVLWSHVTQRLCAGAQGQVQLSIFGPRKLQKTRPCASATRDTL